MPPPIPIFSTPNVTKMMMKSKMIKLRGLTPSQRLLYQIVYYDDGNMLVVVVSFSFLLESETRKASPNMIHMLVPSLILCLLSLPRQHQNP